MVEYTSNMISPERLPFSETGLDLVEYKRG